MLDIEMPEFFALIWRKESSAKGGSNVDVDLPCVIHSHTPPSQVPQSQLPHRQPGGNSLHQGTEKHVSEGSIFEPDVVLFSAG